MTVLWFCCPPLGFDGVEVDICTVGANVLCTYSIVDARLVLAYVILVKSVRLSSIVSFVGVTFCNTSIVTIRTYRMLFI